MTARVLCLLVCLSAPAWTAAQQTRRVYHVGNSVTDAINYAGLAALAQSRQQTHVWGRHMIPGAPLEWIWNHPNDGFAEQPFGHYPSALPNFDWDALTLQPFDRQIDSDRDYSGRYIDLLLQRPANAATQVYVYSRWPRRNGDGTLDFQRLWDRTYTGGWDGTNESRDYFVDLLHALRQDYQGSALQKTPLMVPVGDVLYELDRRMEAGQVPGFNDVIAFYEDGIHFTNVGSYVVGLTFYATIYRDHPKGLPVPDAWAPRAGKPQDQAIAPELAQLLQDAVWSVVAGHAHSGVIAGDFSRDGRVDVSDLGILATHWQQHAPYAQGDADGDGTVDVSDLGIVASHWQGTAEQWNAALAEHGLASIPEPAAGIAAALAIASAARLR